MDKPDVFMPLYIGDYLAGTSRLTTELHGAYMLLIMDYWMNGPLPNDDAILASITKMTPDAWSNARACLEHYFSIDQACWKHKRVEQELAQAFEKKRIAKEKAERAAAARWEKSSKSKPNSKNTSSSNARGNATSSAQAMHEECPSPSPSPSPSKNNIKHTSDVPSDAPDEKPSQESPPEKPKAKPKPSKFKFNDAQYDIAVRISCPSKDRFGEKLKINWDEWADAIRKLEEIDGHSLRDIEALWRWIVAHDNGGFSWADNCRTPMKLRQRKDGMQYFDIIQSQMRREVNHAGNQSQQRPGGHQQSGRPSLVDQQRSATQRWLEKRQGQPDTAQEGRIVDGQVVGFDD